MEYDGKAFAVSGRVESVINDGYAKRTVFLDNGRSFRIIKSQIAYAIENTEYRENVHTFYLTHSGIYLSHTHESCGEE